MINALRFAQGALKSTALVPELEYYQIKNGRVLGSNGHMTLSAPIDLSIEAKPKAKLFHQALQACGDTVSIGLTEGGRLHVRSGGFSAFIPCIEKEIYEPKPDGEVFPAPPGLLAAAKRLYNIISLDASRPWAMGLNVGGGFYTATNNIAIVQIWDGNNLPHFNCPRFSVAELIRIGENPDTIQITENSVTFGWEDGRWLQTLILSDEWPETLVEKLLDAGRPGEPLPDGFFDALEKIKPFIPDKSNTVCFGDNILVAGPHLEQVSASHDVEGLEAGPKFSEKVLSVLKDEITTIDFSAYPEACGFRGPSSRGIILGQR